MKASKVVLLLALLLTFGAFSATSFGLFVSAQGDQAVDEDDRVETEDEVYEEGQAEPGTAGGQGQAGQGATGEDVTPEEPEIVVGPAADVETSYIFTQYVDEELPAGKVVKCLLSFHNSGEEKKSYRVETIGASLRYPMDYTYYLQNFTRQFLNKSVDSDREATFMYAFRTSDHFSGRPFGLVIEINYFDAEDKAYVSTVFNKTVNFVELDDAFDAEAILLYLLFAAVGVLIFVIVYYYASGANKKSKKSARVETGSHMMNGTGLSDFLPQHLKDAHKAPKVTPSSPKGKKSKKDN